MDVNSALPARFQLQSSRVAALPVLNHFIQRWGIPPLLEKHLPPPDPRSKLLPAQVLLTLLRNLVLSHRPLYSLGEWAAGMDAGCLGLTPGQTRALNDDRVGRALDDLFDADRQALLTDLVVRLIQEFRIDLSELHNDSTSLTLFGDYPQGDGRRVRGKPSVQVTWGYNKDHRPDLKQLLWILTISADGAVPVHFKVANGNTEDSSTHLETWKLLRGLMGRADFLYVADCKLCVPDILRFIDKQGGGFLTPLPGGRREDTAFREWLVSHVAEWREVGRRPLPYERTEIIQALESPIPEASGFRLVWFLNSQKRDIDAHRRQDAILRANQKLDELRAKLEGPKCRYHRQKQVTRAVETILAQTGAGRWVDYQVEWVVEVTTHREGKPPKPGQPPRRYRTSRPRFRLSWTPNLQNIHADAQADGISPFVTNRADLPAWEIYTAYHNRQSLLEKRHDLLKNTLKVTPAYLHNVSRLEALLFLEYLALTLHALIERQLRQAMRQHDVAELPIYPEGRECKAPTAGRLFEILDHLQSHTLLQERRLVQIFPPELSPVERQLLDLLEVPAESYTNIGA